MVPLISYILLIGLSYSCGQEDSLKSALNAINRRQRDLSDYDDNEYGYTLERPDDIAFLKSPAYDPDRPYEITRPLVNYIDDDKYDQDINKRLSSAFRERVEEDNQRQLEEIAQNLISNAERKGRYNLENDDYEELLREFWDKYRRPYERPRSFSRLDKRIYYPKLGMDSIGLKKRNAYGSEGYSDSYWGSDEDFTDEDEDYPVTNNIKKRYYQRGNKLYNRRAEQMYPYPSMKHFPVTKRSSDYAKEVTHEHRSTKKQTDPNVEKELSDIFSGKKPHSTTTVKTTVSTVPTTTKGDKAEVSTTNPKENKKPSITDHKEEYSSSMVSEKPLQIKKKSIDWSDYFGLDRRKKSPKPDDLDKEWLIERYHKSIAMTTKKRNAELPLSSFRKHDDQLRLDLDENNDQKIDEMDNKLKMLEDKIVDDALKYTGAHEGEGSPQTIQETKDRVISRLAAAYNIEKMRNALSEYKSLVSQSRRPDGDYGFLEEKRTSVPRKSVIDKDREGVLDADNNIKCTDGDDDCHEQNYKTPTEIVESHFGTEECPVIERACSEVASTIGLYGHTFKTACNMHQMCLLCSNNSWFSPTRQCNALFIAKAYDLCKNSMLCQREAQKAVKYLLDVNRNLHSQPTAVNECELSCPDTDAIFDPNYR